jgi:hypothetical protein
MAIEALIVNVAGDGENSYVRGDVAVIKPQGWHWGFQEDPATRTREPLDKFVIITVLGLTESETQFMLDTWETVEEGEPVLIQKRVARLDFSRLSTEQQADLAATGRCTVTVNNINNLRNLMQRKDV